MKKTSVLSVILCILACGLIFYSQRGANEIRTRLLDKQAYTKVENANDLSTARLQARMEDSLQTIQSACELVLSIGNQEVVSLENERNLRRQFLNYGFYEVSLCNTEGEAMEPGGSMVAIGENANYKRAVLGDSVVCFEAFREEERETVVFYAPLVRGEKVVAVLRAAWDPAMLGSYLSTTEFRGREDVCIINPAGAIITSLSGTFDQLNSLQNLYPKRNEACLQMEQVIKQGRKMTEHVTDKGGVSYYFSYNGIRKINDWGVATIIRETDLTPLLSENYGKLSDDSMGYLAMGAIVVLLGILLYQAKKRYTLERMAYVDGVTKSYNFKGFMKRMKTAFEKDPTAKYAFLQITLERFDYFTETFGHAEANKALYFMSTVLSEAMQRDEAYCRYNTQNFILLMKYQSDEELKERILYLKNRIGSTEENARINDKFTFNLIVGVYCLSHLDMNIDDMIKNAGIAMENARSNKRSPFEFFRETAQGSKAESNEFEARMYDALHEKEFLVYLQPKFSLKDGTQTGAEALVRWMHPEKGLVFPGRFIPLFEKNGFIVELDMYILEELCRRLKLWIKLGYRPMPVSLNVSMHNFFNSDFVDRVNDIVNRYGVPASLLMIEISESDIAGSIELAKEIIERLKSEGYLVSMDNFGKTATSMNTLYQMQLDEVKIDRRFLLDMIDSERGQSVIDAVVGTAQKFNIPIVADGVENKSQAQLLRDIGCDMMQGFVFSEPLPEQEYEEYAYGDRADENRVSI